METVKAVVLAFLIIGVLAMAIILSLTTIRNTADNIDITTGKLNETVYLGDTGNATSVANIRGVSLSSIIMSNSTTGGGVVPATNYTTSNGYLYGVAGGAYNNSVVRIQSSYSYPSPSSTNVVGNITSGLTTFFRNTGTIFSILAVIVIILAITIIIYAVSRFGGGTTPGV